jgi:uncharacterized SAM-binding protein YcdF (DUF218 family)
MKRASLPPRRRRRGADLLSRLPAAAQAGAPMVLVPGSAGGRGRRRRHGRPHGWLLAGIAVASLLWLTRGWWLPPPPRPQLILVLGGDVDREKAAARLARHDGLPVLVSSGTNPEYATWLFHVREGLPAHHLHLDYRATDTLTNFTSLVDDLHRARIRHALLVTSSDHMERALLVGRIVAGSRGIALTPIAVACGQHCQPETRRRIWGDGLRALIWVVSGRDLRHWAEEHLAPWLPGGLERSGRHRASS